MEQGFTLGIVSVRKLYLVGTLLGQVTQLVILKKIIGKTGIFYATFRFNIIYFIFFLIPNSNINNRIGRDLNFLFNTYINDF